MYTFCKNRHTYAKQRKIFINLVFLSGSRSLIPSGPFGKKLIEIPVEMIFLLLSTLLLIYWGHAIWYQGVARGKGRERDNIIGCQAD